MKIAISADLHLISKQQTPDRFAAIKNVFDQCKSKGIKKIIFAGDTFDKEIQDFSDFDRLCKNKEYEGISISIIPGNHDEFISTNAFTAKNLEVFSEIALEEVESDFGILYIPYDSETSFGESLESANIKSHYLDWILIGHGDYIEGLSQPNPREPGVYMPLSRKDLDKYQPTKVFLGHIHKPFTKGLVTYPGSPCGLDITEDGYRYFVVWDTKTRQLENIKVDTEKIYLDERLVLYPNKNEVKTALQQLQESVDRWGISKQDNKKIVLRLKLEGYSSSRKSIAEAISKAVDEFTLYEEIDTTKLFVSEDKEREYLVDLLREELADTELTDTKTFADEETILLEALKLIYGA